MAGKLLWFSVVLIVAGAIGIALATSNGAMSVIAKAYVQTFD